MTAATGDANSDYGEVVLTFGNSGRKVYHRPVMGPDGDSQPRCGARGGTLFKKKRSLIESHYDPCGTCFPDRGGGE